MPDARLPEARLPEVPPPKAGLPEHVLFLMRHALIGFAMSAVIVGIVAGFDLGGFRSLAARSGSVFVAFPILAAFLGLTLASVQMGAAIMLLPRDETPRGGGTRVGARLAAFFAPPARLAPVRVAANPRR